MQCGVQSKKSLGVNRLRLAQEGTNQDLYTTDSAKETKPRRHLRGTIAFEINFAVAICQVRTAPQSAKNIREIS